MFSQEVIQYTDGSNTTVGRRERPWMLFGQGGAPLALVTSIEGGNRHGDSKTWTMVQGVATAPMRGEQDAQGMAGRRGFRSGGGNTRTSMDNYVR